MNADRRVPSVSVPVLTVVLGFLAIPAITNSGGEASAAKPLRLIYYDGHMHTTSSDGSGSLEQIKATARARGLSAVMITDHCEDLTLEEWESLAKGAKKASDKEFLILLGVENTGGEGMLNRDHFLAYDVSDPFVGDDEDEFCPSEIWPSPLNLEGTGALYPENLAMWSAYTHAQGAVAVHAHTSGTTQQLYDVDLIEVYNESQVEDIAAIAAPQVGEELAYQVALVMNNLALYGERDLDMMVSIPGIPIPLSLKDAIYLVTWLYVSPNIPQALGSPEAPLNSWDDLLMDYVDGIVDKPAFAVANSDAHNTGWADDPLDSNVGLAKNGVYVKKLKGKEIFESLMAGRSFATTGPSIAFEVEGEMMGGTAAIVDGTSTLHLSVKSESPTATLAKIDIIKNGSWRDTGEFWRTVNPIGPDYEATLVDEEVTEDGYYRVEVTAVDQVTGAPSFAWSNPIFIDVP